MCGICGYIDKKSTGDDINTLIRRMNKLIEHRGPDEDGFFTRDNVALGMRRLKVIDLATGRQPIFNETGDIVVFFNGEIYNFKEIRAELIKKGHIFKTSTDTEILAHGYEEYKEGLLCKLNGMFAFCIYDTKQAVIFIARDRVGIKPLYYCDTPGFFAFASEIKSLLEVKNLSKDLDLAAINEYLTLEYSLAPKTVLKEVKKLLPGHYLILKSGQIQINKYWDLQFQKSTLSQDEYKERLNHTLSQAVKRMLVSDVPLGAFLSGGIDSSIMVGLMAQASGARIKTFSIGFTNQSYNELEYARLIARRFNTEHYESIIDSNLCGFIDNFITYLDEPMADVSIFPTYLISKEARKNVTVILSGDGGDELFGGYEAYLAHNFYNRLYAKLPSLITKTALPALARSLAPTKKKKGLINRIKRFVEGCSYPEKLMHYRWMSYLHNDEKENLYTPEFKNRLSGTDAFESVSGYIQRFSGWDTLNQMMLTDLFVYLPEDILTKVDRMSMAVSLEARVPYLDHEVVELAYTIPGKFKISGSSTKKILKDAFSNLLPKEILERKKEGFSIPLKNWLREELKEKMREVLGDSSFSSIGLFNSAHINTLMDEHITGKQNHAHKLWALMVFGMWHKKYIGAN